MVKKISIIGAGAVGSSLAFNLLCRLHLKELVLVDISGDLARGVALDLEDTRGFLNFSTKILGTKNFSHIKDSDIVVITAGVARRDGMSRLDLLQINAKVAREVSQKIKKFAPYSIIIVVTNPLDIITYIVLKETTFPRLRVLGMGSSLDTSRLMNILYNKLDICVSSLEGYVFGLHNKDMMLMPRAITVKGQSLSSFLDGDTIEKIKERVQLRGEEIVSFLKNRSAHFAPSLSCCRLIEAIVYDKNEIIPLSVFLKGEYGLQNVCMGVPCLVNDKGVERIIEIDLTAQEKQSLEKVKDVFRDAAQIIEGR